MVIVMRLCLVGVMLLAVIGCSELNSSDPDPAAPQTTANTELAAPDDANQPEPLRPESPPDPDSPSAAQPENPATQSTESNNSAAATATLYEDSFTDVEGTIRWTRDGVKTTEGPPGRRTIYFYHGMFEGGPLVMRAVEDNVTLGPDGQPGVLAFSWQEIPPKLGYSGFTYLGRSGSEGRLSLPPLKAATSASDLARLRVKFRYQLANDRREGPMNLTVGLRLEPMLTEPYNKRLDLGTFNATGEWESFDMSLGDATNVEAFLRAIADESPSAFKLNWSQSGPLNAYQPGDTLLIDDLVISDSPADHQ